MNQPDLFLAEPRPTAHVRAFLVTHLHGYTPQAPEKTLLGAWPNEAEAKRAARARRAGWAYATHIELESLEVSA